MTWKLSCGVLITAALIAPGNGATAQESEDNLEISHDLDARHVTWNQIEGAAYYEVSGFIAYLHFPSCVPGLDEAISEGVTFQEQVGPDTNLFPFPPPQNPAADSIKDIELTIRAVAEDGRELDIDGFAFTADRFCSPDEIAAELAAAGTGLTASQSPLPALPIVGLLALLGLGLLGSAMLMRRAA